MGGGGGGGGGAGTGAAAAFDIATTKSGDGRKAVGPGAGCPSAGAVTMPSPLTLQGLHSIVSQCLGSTCIKNNPP